MKICKSLITSLKIEIKNVRKSVGYLIPAAFLPGSIFARLFLEKRISNL